MIQDHVVSLDLSKQLYEAGIKIAEPTFWWCSYTHMVSGKDIWEIQYSNNKKPLDPYIAIPAPLSSELGELLPMEVNIPFKSGKRRAISNSLHIYHTNTGWHINYIARGVDERPSVSGDTEANARAKCLLYLVEKGIIKPNELQN